MARFRAIIRGNRGEASRLGSQDSGIRAYINGWNIGVHVYIFVNDEGKDEIRVWKTGGSNRKSADELIASFGEQS